MTAGERRTDLTISLEPEPVEFGNPLELTVSGWDRDDAPWGHLVAFEADGDQVRDLEQYVKLVDGRGVFTVGPTPSWEINRGGTGYVEVGYWFRGSRFRVVADVDFEVVADT